MASSSNAAVAVPGLVLDALERAPVDRALPSPQDPKAAWVASQLGELTPEERATYERGAFFRGLVDLVLDEDWNDPGRVERARQVEESLREMYGGDADREIDDLEAARHPLQQRR